MTTTSKIINFIGTLVAAFFLWAFVADAKYGMMSTVVVFFVVWFLLHAWHDELARTERYRKRLEEVTGEKYSL